MLYIFLGLILIIALHLLIILVRYKTKAHQYVPRLPTEEKEKRLNQEAKPIPTKVVTSTPNPSTPRSSTTSNTSTYVFSSNTHASDCGSSSSDGGGGDGGD